MHVVLLMLVSFMRDECKWMSLFALPSQPARTSNKIERNVGSISTREKARTTCSHACMISIKQ